MKFNYRVSGQFEVGDAECLADGERRMNAALLSLGDIGSKVHISIDRSNRVAGTTRMTEVGVTSSTRAKKKK